MGLVNKAQDGFPDPPPTPDFEIVACLIVRKKGDPWPHHFEHWYDDPRKHVDVPYAEHDERLHPHVMTFEKKGNVHG